MIVLGTLLFILVATDLPVCTMWNHPPRSTNRTRRRTIPADLSCNANLATVRLYCRTRRPADAFYCTLFMVLQNFYREKQLDLCSVNGNLFSCTCIQQIPWSTGFSVHHSVKPQAAEKSKVLCSLLGSSNLNHSAPMVAIRT